jgi:hypothetical protein
MSKLLFPIFFLFPLFLFPFFLFFSFPLPFPPPLLPFYPIIHSPSRPHLSISTRPRGLRPASAAGTCSPSPRLHLASSPAPHRLLTPRPAFARRLRPLPPAAPPRPAASEPPPCLLAPRLPASSRFACPVLHRPALAPGQRSKGEAEPVGATFSWLHLPSGSRPRLHR